MTTHLPSSVPPVSSTGNSSWREELVRMGSSCPDEIFYAALIERTLRGVEAAVRVSKISTKFAGPTKGA